MELKVIYKDKDILVIDKPAGIIVFPERKIKEKISCGEQSRTIIDYFLEKFPILKNVGQSPRFGIVHRLDKETSGILLIAKNNETLEFLQRQFRERRVIKKYLALVIGKINERGGEINTLIGRAPKDRRKQKVYLPFEPEAKGKKLRKAITEYRVLAHLRQDSGEKTRYYTLIEAIPKTGRKHQIRCHLAHLSHPIAGDKLYGFKNQPKPQHLNRLFLHAYYLKTNLNDREIEFKSDLPKDLKDVSEKLNYDDKN